MRATVQYDETTRVLTAQNPNDMTAPVTCAAMFEMHIRRLTDCGREFLNVDRSSSKAETIKRGVEKYGDQELAARLAGHKFVLYRHGNRETPRFFQFSPEWLEEVEGIVPAFDDEPFIPDGQLTGDVYEATKHKVAFKKILHFAHLITTNTGDDNIVFFEIRSEPNHSTELLDAIFQMGFDESDLRMTLTEATNFTINPNREDA